MPDQDFDRSFFNYYMESRHGYKPVIIYFWMVKLLWYEILATLSKSRRTIYYNKILIIISG